MILLKSTHEKLTAQLRASAEHWETLARERLKVLSQVQNELYLEKRETERLRNLLGMAAPGAPSAPEEAETPQQKELKAIEADLDLELSSPAVRMIDRRRRRRRIAKLIARRAALSGQAGEPDPASL